MDEDGIRKIDAVIVDEKGGVEYHLSTGNAYPDAKEEMGLRSQRKARKSEKGEPESKSMVISQTNMHASMNTRESSKGIFRSSKSVLYE